MTPTVADTTSNPAKDWRRHSDPPGLWIGVVIGSVALHLLAFWLLRSYQSSLLWQQQSKSTIPIELVEISAQPKSTATLKARVKPASPKSGIVTQKLPKQVVPTQKLTAKPAPVTQDESAIALAAQQKREQAAQQQRELAAQQKREQAAQQQRELAAQSQRELAAQQQQLAAEQKQKRQQAAQRQRELAAQSQHELAAQQQQLAAEQKRQQAAQQKREQAAQQRENTNNTDNQKPLTPPANAAGGTLIAGLVGEPQQGERDRHTNPAKIKPSNQPFTKGLEYIKYMEKGSGQPVEVTAILTISEKGKLEHVAIAEPSLSAEEKTHYEDVINEVLKSWEYEPAYDNDPKDPKPSNLTVRIRIQPQP